MFVLYSRLRLFGAIPINFKTNASCVQASRKHEIMFSTAFKRMRSAACFFPSRLCVRVQLQHLSMALVQPRACTRWHQLLSAVRCSILTQSMCIDIFKRAFLSFPENSGFHKRIHAPNAAASALTSTMQEPHRFVSWLLYDRWFSQLQRF